MARAMSDEQKRHWDTVCIGMMTLATAVIAGIFGLLGLGNAARSNPPDLVGVVILFAAIVSVLLYLLCLMYGIEAILDTSSSGNTKFALARRLINTFYAMVVFVVLVAGFTIIDQLSM